jgi:hypothetical protein
LSGDERLKIAGQGDLPTLKLSTDLVLHLSAPSAVFGLKEADWLKLAQQAIRVWHQGCTSCDLPQLTVALWSSKQPAPVGEDALSVLRIRTGNWCPDHVVDVVDCYTPARRGITHIYRDKSVKTPETVHFREADIEINLSGLREDAPNYSLEERVLATLVHEIGHVYGLDHPCLASLDPSCRNVEARKSVMYPDATESGRALVFRPSAGDAALLARKYPKGWSQTETYGVWGGGLVSLLLIGLGVRLVRNVRKHRFSLDRPGG